MFYYVLRLLLGNERLFRSSFTPPTDQGFVYFRRIAVATETGTRRNGYSCVVQDSF